MTKLTAINWISLDGESTVKEEGSLNFSML